MGMPKGHVRRNRSGQIVASQGLTDRQKAFVFRYIENGGNGRDAAKYAGYAYPDQSHHDLMHTPHVLAFMRSEHARIIQGELASAAVNVLREILTDTRKDKDFSKLKLDASKTVLDRAGHITPKEKDKEHGKSLEDMSIDELEGFIRKARQAQDNADKPMIEGECEPIGEQDDAQVIDNDDESVR